MEIDEVVKLAEKESGLKNVPNDPWSVAREYHTAIGPIPSLFSACIRSINKVEAILNPIDNDGARDIAVSSAEFLVKVSPTLKAVFYFAQRRMYPDNNLGNSPLTPHSLLLVFTPREIATIVGLTYLYRRAAKRCDSKEWLLLSRKAQVQMELGFLLGSNMQLLGTGQGMLLGGIRFFAVACYAIKNPTGYAEYRRKLLNKKTYFDAEIEERIFGCNHMHVASFLCQALGFCMPRSTVGMSLGMDALNISGDVLPGKLREQLSEFNGVLSAIDTMHRTQELVQEAAGYQLKISSDKVDILEKQVRAAVKTPSFDWMTKCSSDLPPEVAHLLIKDEEEGLLE